MKYFAPWTLALCFSAQIVGVCAQNATPVLTAQERLDAIRHSLVETALQGATQVKTTLWLDAQGQLHDSSSFRSGMEVRGVRVMSYSRDNAGQAKAQLDATEPPKDLARRLADKSARNKTCAQGAAGNLRHVIGLNTVFDVGTPAGVERLVREQIASQWLRAQDRNWRMLDQSSAPPLLSMGSNQTGYEKALTGHGLEQLPWKADLRIGASTVPLMALERLTGMRPHHMNVTMTLSVSPMDGQGPQFQAAYQMTLPLDRQEWSSPSLSPEGADKLQAQWAQWSDRLSPWLGCDTVHPKVTDHRAQSLQINAGELAGVRKGDEWLLADPQSFPSRVVDKQSDSMLLAKVMEVTPHHARLAVVAGPAKAIQMHWRAWPADSLNR
jgi:hypothetical protein